MSNRTDFHNLVNEILHGHPLELQRRVETELHNAFVAGQERSEHLLVAVRNDERRACAVLAAPYHRPTPDGCPRFCAACERSRQIRDAILARIEVEPLPGS
jgi:hypothetical protein